MRIVAEKLDVYRYSIYDLTLTSAKPSLDQSNDLPWNETLTRLCNETDLFFSEIVDFLNFF